MRILISVLLLISSFACSDDTPDTNNSTDDVAGSTDMNDMAPDAMQVDDIGEDVDMVSSDMSDVGEDTSLPEIPITWPATPDEFVLSSNQASYVFELTIPEIVQFEAACCEDFGVSPPGIDNGYADMVATLIRTGLDPQATIDASLMSGELILLLDHRELDGPEDGDGFVLSWFTGVWASTTDYAQASAGTGEFNLAATDFNAGTGTPTSIFNPVALNGENVRGAAPLVRFPLPVIFATVIVPLHQATIAGTMTLATDEITYTNGKIAGYVELDDIFGALNLLIESRCGCLALATPLYSKVNDEWEDNCPPNTDVCTQPDEAICYAFAGVDFDNGGFCGAVSDVINAHADLDENDDGIVDAMTIGFQFSATAATFSEVAP